MSEWHFDALAVTFGISLLHWLNRLLVLNRFRSCRVRRIEWVSLAVFLMGGYAQWITLMCVPKSNGYALQFTAGFLRQCMHWFGFILIVNEELRVTAQQATSLAMVVFTQVLWDVGSRIVIPTTEA